MSLLITPIQRVPRYLLLLDKVLEYTPPIHPEYEIVSKAVQGISEIAKIVNDRKREEENKVKQCCLCVLRS